MTEWNLWQHEIATAAKAVRLAAEVCRDIQRKLAPEHEAAKADRSPVTAADFASQAVVCVTLAQSFPSDAIVGEEASGSLRQDAGAALRAAAVNAVSTAMRRSVWEEEVMAWIDHGAPPGISPGNWGKRYWTLDPIDGTKGFLRRGQYAVALALLEEGQVVLGVLACPELPDDRGGRGVLLAARRGGGTVALPLWESAGVEAGRVVRVQDVADPAMARFCESVEGSHSDQGTSARIAKRLGITAAPLRMDSQAKYATIARGEAQIYLRLPTRADYRENIWDHAAGMIVVQEAGGRVTDIHGKPLDFSRGRTLEENRGIVATSGGIHDRVVEAVREGLGSRVWGLGSGV